MLGYWNYNVGQARSDHLWCRYYGNGWDTALEIALFGSMVAPKSGGMHVLLSYENLPLQDSTPCPGYLLLKGPFNPSQTLNSQIKKGTNSLIRLIGVTTAKWLQNGAALLFLSHTSSLAYYFSIHAILKLLVHVLPMGTRLIQPNLSIILTSWRNVYVYDI